MIPETKTMKRTLISLAITVIATLPCLAAAQSDQPIVVPLSDPAAPAALDVSLLVGSITVTAYEGDEVMIVPHESGDPEPARTPSLEGFRRIPNTSMGLTAEERGNTVSIDVDFTTREIELDISVPRNTSVRAGVVNGGALNVEGVTGEHELSNVNGPVLATDIAGSAVVDTTNGDLKISFTEITPDQPMSFTSFNGNVDVTFPAGLSADLVLNAGNGDVLTDFDIDVEPQAPAVERSSDGGRYRVRLERDIRAVVGSGGPEIRFETVNGNIVIRRR
jgi:hypothetical protein